MKILFKTFPVGHLVSDKEYERLRKGFAKVGVELLRDTTDQNYDILRVKGFSHIYADIPKDKPIVYLSIGAEYKRRINITLDNEPIRELYEHADAVVHISEHCKWEHEKVFGVSRGVVIIPAEEAKLPEKYTPVSALTGRLKLATTCIPRPVKRVEELERLCKKYDIELVPAYGNVSDFSYYNDCQGYIHLSRKEGMPNTVLEALAYGLPCIVTNYGGAAEAVGDAGVIIKNDPEDVMWDPDNIEPIDDYIFFSAVQGFINYLPMLQVKVRERVLTELNDKIMAAKFKEVFELCLNKR